jgi:spoIIIJ-associated protein
VDTILRGLGISAISTIGKPQGDNPNTYPINIDGDDSGLLIGRRGETLRAFQFLVSRIAANQDPDSEGRIILDVEQYRQRRAMNLTSLAIRMADRVQTSGRMVALEPMPSDERRVIHMALADHPKVSTESTGERDERQVTIRPRKS